MIGECLDVLSHRPAVNDLFVTDCVTLIFFSETNTVLVDQASSHRLMVSQLLGISSTIQYYFFNPLK